MFNASPPVSRCAFAVQVLAQLDRVMPDRPRKAATGAAAAEVDVAGAEVGDVAGMAPRGPEFARAGRGRPAPGERRSRDPFARPGRHRRAAAEGVPTGAVGPPRGGEGDRDLSCDGGGPSPASAPAPHGRRRFKAGRRRTSPPGGGGSAGRSRRRRRLPGFGVAGEGGWSRGLSAPTPRAQPEPLRTEVCTPVRRPRGGPSGACACPSACLVEGRVDASRRRRGTSDACRRRRPKCPGSRWASCARSRTDRGPAR